MFDRAKCYTILIGAPTRNANPIRNQAPKASANALIHRTSNGVNIFDVMSKKERQAKDKQSGHIKKKKRWHDDLSLETKKSIWALALFVIAAIMILAWFGRAGAVGGYLFEGLSAMLGKGYLLAPVSFAFGGTALMLSMRNRLYASVLIGAGCFLIFSLGIIELIWQEKTGGYIGFAVSYPLQRLLDFWASLLILAALDLAAVLIAFNIPLWARGEDTDEDEEEIEKEETVIVNVRDSLKGMAENVVRAVTPKASPELIPAASGAFTKHEDEFLVAKRLPRYAYKRPPLDLLNSDKGKPSSGDIKANANIIQRTLENFGVQVEMSEVSVGPTVTQYTLKPAEGVKLSRIVALQNDLSLALAAHPIRVEAPIPGKSLVGIEVPNRSIALVGLRSLLEDTRYQQSAAPLLFTLGRDVTGSAVHADLAKMPHLMIAGSTGSGKSVSMHTIIVSYLYRNPPEVVRFIMIDPKRVELSMYNGIPHLLTPAITDSKKTIQALRWAVREMERRYELLEERGARDLVSYNLKTAEAEEDEEGPMPYLVVIVDELADLMVAFPREIEGSVVRLAQMARAVGIHLILTTQRPSVEVITGLIKANITSRVAFQTGSQIDSRTIIDIAGAEKLLGNGDMLFLAGDTAKPRRIQGAFVSESEVRKVVDFLKKEVEAPVYDEAITEMKVNSAGIFGGAFDEADDEMYEEAKEIVIESGKASTSFLQRRLKLGYARAARIMDLLEENGIVGPGSGAKPRDVLVGRGGSSADAEIGDDAGNTF